MKTITVKANNQVGTVAEHTVVTQTNTPTVIKATDKTNYEIFDTVEGRAPKDIITKRVDKDLHVSFENDIQNTDLIIEGFYDNIDSALIGVADDGSYYYYVPDTGEMTDYVTELQMGEVQSQSLGGNSYATPWWIGATEAEGLSALPWLFGLAGVGIAAGSLGGSDSSSNSPVDTMAPDAPTSINVGNGDAFITADEITDGQVSVVVGLPSNAVSGDVVIVNGTEQNLSEDDILNGNVIVQVNAPAEGELFNVSATLRDEAGNESDALDITVGVVDTIAPDTPAAAPEISDNVANDGSGDVLDPAEIIGADGLTNDSTPSVVVPADQLANGTPQLVIDGVVVASIAETNTDGSVSLTPTDPLLDGEYDVSYNIKDAAGNVSDNAPVVTVIVDTTTSITIIEPIAGDNVINGDEAAEGFNVRGTGTAGDTVTLTNGLGTVIGSGVVSDNGQWIINVNSVQINAMGEGTESLTATAKDAAGNTAVATADITVVSATTVSISSPIAGDNVINADEAAEGFDVRGTGTAGDTITLFSESGNIIGTAIVDANNKWIIPVDEDDVDEMGQGAETLTVQAEDAVGNISTETASITVGVDTIAPGGGTDATQVAPVVAIAEAADGVNATEFQNGVQTQVTLPTGTIAGDIVTLTVTPDGGAPITVDYVVTAEDLSGDGIAEVTIPNNTIGGITADGGYSVTAVVTDAAGNSSAVSDAVGFIVDTIAPDTPAAAPEISDNVANDGSGDVLDPAEIIGADGLTNDSTPSVVVPVDQLANGTPQLVIDGVVVASIAETNTDGSVSLTPTDPLLDGEYDVSYNIKDAAGNVSDNAPVVTVNVDTIAPGGGTDATQVAPVVAIAEAADGVNATEFQNGVQTQVTLPTGTIAGDIVTLTVTPDGGAPITVDYVVTAEDLSGDGIAEVTIPNNTIGGITADGDYSVTAVVTDAAGNSSAVSDAVGFTVDVTIIAQDDTANLDLALQVTTLVAISEEESTILEALETNNGTESNLSFTVNDNTSGTVNIELTESALVQVADAISLEVYNSDNELVYIAANVNNPLVGNVAGLEVLGLTNNNGSLTATLSGLEPGDYKIVVSKDSSTLETLINDLTVSELGEAGVVLGHDNQTAILDAVQDSLGFPLGGTVRIALAGVLNLTTDIGVGEFLSIAQPILIAAGAPIDPLLDAVAAEVLSNTLALLETTEVTATLTEYSFDNNTVVSGNVIDPDLNSIGEIGEDIVTANTVLTNIIGANGIATSTQLDGVNAFSINGEYGVLIIDEYGKYEYRANGDYASSGQSDVFTYTIFDDVTGASDTAELVIDLTYTIDMAAGDDIVNITDNVLQSSLDGLDDNANTINIDSSLSVNIIGGEGFDTINLTGAGQTLSLSDIFQTEVIDISGTGANTLTLQAADITNSGTSDPIYVKGDSDDTVDLGGVGADLSDTDGANSPSVWVDAGTDVTDTNGQVYNVWQLDNNAATQIYIDTDITVI